MLSPSHKPLAASLFNKSYEMRLLYITIISMVLTSCLGGIYEMLRGYDKYVFTNSYGRKELQVKKFKEEFTADMAEVINCNMLYYSYYQHQEYKRHAYLIFYKTGQYAYFASVSGEISVFDDLNKAQFIGYYIVKDHQLILETPTGNFNTYSYRLLWNFTIQNKTLKRQGDRFNEEFKISEKMDLTINKIPNW
jgi:hypothetical protein